MNAIWILMMMVTSLFQYWGQIYQISLPLRAGMTYQFTHRIVRYEIFKVQGT